MCLAAHHMGASEQMRSADELSPAPIGMRPALGGPELAFANCCVDAIAPPLSLFLVRPIARSFDVARTVFKHISTN